MEQDATSSIISTESSAENLDKVHVTSTRRNKAFKRQSRVQEEDIMSKKVHCQDELCKDTNKIRATAEQVQSESRCLQKEDFTVEHPKDKVQDNIKQSDPAIEEQKCNICHCEKTAEVDCSKSDRGTQKSRENTPPPPEQRKKSDKISQRRKSKGEQKTSSDSLSSLKREKSVTSASERKRRSRQYDDDSPNDEDYDEDSNSESIISKRRKTPTKKVMKLHNLTADLLFQVGIVYNTLAHVTCSGHT